MRLKSDEAAVLHLESGVDAGSRTSASGADRTFIFEQPIFYAGALLRARECLLASAAGRPCPRHTRCAPTCAQDEAAGMYRPVWLRALAGLDLLLEVSMRVAMAWRVGLLVASCSSPPSLAAPVSNPSKRRCVACDSCTLARRRPSHAHQTQDSIWQTGNVVPVWLRMLALTCARRSCSTPSRAHTQRAWMRVDCVGQRFATSWGPTVSRKLWQNTLCACYICVMGLGGP